MTIVWDVDFRADVAEIEDQGTEGSCVANAVTNYCEMLTRRAGSWQDLSRQFPYYYTREYENNLGGEGCMIEDMLRLGATYGFCLESEWPYTLADKNTKPSTASYLSGKTRLITAWEKIPLSTVNVWASVAAINKALDAGFPVVFTMALYDGYRKIVGPLDTQTYQDAGTYIGRHEQVIVGRSSGSSKWLGLNSWGTAWGDHGYVAIPYGSTVNFSAAYIITGFNGITLSSPFKPGEVMPTTIKLTGTANSAGEIAFQHNTPNLTQNLLRANGFYLGVWGERLPMNIAFVDGTYIKCTGAVPNTNCIVSFEY